MSATRLFVTGTDTDVGKTVVTGLLGRALGVVAVKPLASGLDLPGPSDVERLERLSGRPAPCFQSWRTPVAPHRAALIEDAPLDVDRFGAWLDQLPADAVVEGVGGWKVPAASGLEMAEVARRVADRVVVVAADRLGVLNHTRLTIEAIERDGLRVVGVVLNRIQPDLSSESNLDDLRSLVDPPVVTLGWIDADTADLDAAASALASGLRLR